ncbi:hypothetical protein D3C76_1635840 [compost metagenome]
MNTGNRTGQHLRQARRKVFNPRQLLQGALQRLHTAQWRTLQGALQAGLQCQNSARQGVPGVDAQCLPASVY